MPNQNAPVQAVIFDYGGVLTTSGRVAIGRWVAAEGIRAETFSDTLKAWLSRDAPAGTPIHRLEIGELSISDFNRLLAQRLRTTDDGPVDADGLLARMFSYMKPEPRMLALVRQLRDSGLRTALLSNSWGNSYPWDMLRGLFELAVISGELGLRKPDPEIYRHTLRELGLAPDDVVFVDDAVPNVEAAEKLGIRAIRHQDVDETRARLSSLIPQLPTVEETR